MTHDPAPSIPPFPLNSGNTSAVEYALGKAVRSHMDSMAVLRRAVEACVAELRDSGVPPESMLITMKAFIRHTACTYPPPGNSASSWAADAYISDIVRWSIAEYYRVTLTDNGVMPFGPTT
jgi:hypothetical protein